MTDFWRALRVISARRWIILAFVVLAAGAVFIGTTLRGQEKHWEAEALLEPQDLPLVNVLGSSNSDGQPSAAANPANAAVERTNRISDVVTVLRSSNDLYLKAAELLRKDEKERAKEVEAIFDRNGYFASTDNALSTQADALVSAKQILPTQKAEWLTSNRAKLRTQVIDGLTKASDAQGSFAATGVSGTPGEIAARINDKMSFDTVNGPLNSDTNPQIANQVRVSGRFEREAEAKLYVNLLCVAFIDYYTNRDATSANAKVALLNTKKTELEGVLHARRKELAAFQRSKGVFATSQQETLSAQLSKTQDQYDQVVQDLGDAEGQVLSLQQSLLTTRDTVSSRLPADQNPQVARLRAELQNAQIELTAALANNGADNTPAVVLARARRDEAQRLLAQEINIPYVSTQVNSAPANVESLLNQARARRDGLLNRKVALTQQLATLKEQVRTLPDARNQLAELNRTISIADNAVKDVEESLSRYQLIAINNGRAGTISIISQASTKPVGGDVASKRGLLALIAAVFAGLLCTAGVVIFDMLDPSVRTSQDAEKLFGLPVEGVIPEQTPDPMLAAWVTYRSPDSPVAEAYRLLRTRLLFTAMEHPFQSLVLVTGRPGQGSTTTAANLAITLAQDGKRVVLVDANLRDPQLHNLFHSSNEVGLTTLLTVNLRLDDVVRPTAIANMELLPAGPMPLNPSELLGSPRMRYIHHELKKRADFVLFDTPSAIAFSDAAILASYVDATLLVVRANNVPRESEKQVRSLLEKARANIIGLVFNAVPADLVDAVHYHAHYYAASRRPDDVIGAAPGGFDPNSDQYDSDPFGGLAPDHDTLGLAVMDDPNGTATTVRPVSPFVPEQAEAGSLAPTPRASKTTQSNPARGATPAPGYRANGNGNSYHTNGNGTDSNPTGPVNTLRTEGSGVATLARPAPLVEGDGNEDDSSQNRYQMDADWSTDEDEDLLEQARREVQGARLVDTPAEPEYDAISSFRGVVEVEDDPIAIFNGIVSTALMVVDTPKVSIDTDLTEERDAPHTLNQSTPPASVVEDPSSEADASLLEDEAAFDYDEPVPPVAPSTFSSAATAPASAPFTMRPPTSEISGPLVVPSPRRVVMADATTAMRPRPNRGSWALWGMLFVFVGIVVAAVLAIGQQINVR